MKHEIVKFDVPELQVINKSKAEQIKATFKPMAEMLSEFEDEYDKLMSIPTDQMTASLTQKYKRLRLDIGKIRIKASKAKDKAKEYIKLEDRAIMGVYNILVWAVKEKEDKLKEREKYFEIQEQKRLEALQLERAKKLAPFVEDAHERDLAKLADDEFEALLAMKKKEYEDQLAAKKKAEEERIAREKAEAEERERIRKENERLKAEAAKRMEKERKEREKLQAKLRAEREKREKIEKEERERREKLEAELRAKKEAEQRAKEEEAAKIQAELNKDDHDRILDLIADIQKIKSKYQFKSKQNQNMFSGVSVLLDKVVDHIKKHGFMANS